MVILEALEQRRLMSATFSDADLNGTWALNAMNTSGTAIFDGAGSVTGGTATDASGDTLSPTGTYSVFANGTASLSVGANLSGALNSSKNFLAFSGSGSDTLGALTNSGSGSFSTGDLNGTWYFFGTGDPSTTVGGQSTYQGNSGHGTISFDGAGNLSGTFISDVNNPTETLTGTDSISSSGGVSLNLEAAQAVQNYSGAMNASKSVAILNPPDLEQAAQYNSARMFVLIQPHGTYSDSSLNGTWSVILDGVQASVDFSGKGKFTGTGTEGAISGKYAVASNGTFTLTLSPTAATKNKTQSYSGAIDSTDTIAAMDQPSGGKNDDLALLVNSGGSAGATDHAPTLTKISTLKGASAGQPFTINFSMLQAASNAADADGDTISFQITSIGDGTLLLDGSAATVGSIFSSGDTITWTPTTKAKGNVSAFDAKAYDGTLASKKAVAVKISITKTKH
ncbi:MAG TPA: hypothetical protein VGG19_11360 [Tepidisphaeraceae bacterium]|jgi:hypothetical protein